MSHDEPFDDYLTNADVQHVYRTVVTNYFRRHRDVPLHEFFINYITQYYPELTCTYDPASGILTVQDTTVSWEVHPDRAWTELACTPIDSTKSSLIQPIKAAIFTPNGDEFYKNMQRYSALFTRVSNWETWTTVGYFGAIKREDQILIRYSYCQPLDAITNKYHVNPKQSLVLLHNTLHNDKPNVKGVEIDLPKTPYPAWMFSPTHHFYDEELFRECIYIFPVPFKMQLDRFIDRTIKYFKLVSPPKKKKGKRKDV